MAADPNGAVSSVRMQEESAFYFLIQYCDNVYTSNLFSSYHTLETLPFLRRVLLLQILRILITQLIVRVPYCLFNSLLTTQTYNRAYTLLDAPSRRNTRHANVVLLSDFLDATNGLLVDLVFAVVNEVLQKLVGLRAARGAVGPGAGESTAGDGRPRDQAHAGVLTIWDLGV